MFLETIDARRNHAGGTCSAARDKLRMFAFRWPITETDGWEKTCISQPLKTEVPRMDSNLKERILLGRLMPPQECGLRQGWATVWSLRPLESARRALVMAHSSLPRWVSVPSTQSDTARSWESYKETAGQARL